MAPRALRSMMKRVARSLAYSREVALAPHANAEGASLELRFRPTVFARVLRRELEAHRGKPALVIPPLPPEALPRGDRPCIVHVVEGITVGGAQKLMCDIIRGLGPRYDMEIVTKRFDAPVAFANFPIHVARNAPSSASSHNDARR